jgi:hypothetical protein
MKQRVVTTLLLCWSMGCGDDDASAADEERLRNCQTTMPADCTATAPWRCEAPSPATVQELDAAVLNGRVYMAGGFETIGSIVTTLRVFEPDTGRWCEGPPLPAPRHHMSLVALDGDLYALGGMQTLAFEPLDTAWVLRAGSDAWEPIAPLPTPRAAGTAGAIDGRIHMVAGEGAGPDCDVLAPTFTYDPATDTWRDDGAPIPTPREHVAGAVHAGELLVFGGRRCSLDTNVATVEAYDPRDDAWRSLPDMPTARGGLAAAVLNGVAYVSGGEEARGAFDAFEALDLESGEWSDPPPPPLPTPRHGHPSVAVDGRVHVLAGADAPLFSPVAVVESFGM